MTAIRETALLLGTIFSLGAMCGCGKVANVLTSNGDGGPNSSNSDGGGGRGNGHFDGGIAASGAGNGTTKRPGGGNGGTGIGAGQDASSSGASSGAGGNADAASMFPDPHGPERKALITQYCSAFDAYPCLKPTVILGDTLHIEGPLMYDAATCSTQLGAGVALSLSPGCWDEWMAAMKCVNAEPHQCPCAGNDCLVAAPLASDDSATDCVAERKTLRDCEDKPSGRYGTVMGRRMQCSWSVSVAGDSCLVYCGPATRLFSANCIGAPGGPYNCTPSLNGRALVDDYWNNALAFVSDTCEQAAQTMADGGGGVSYVDCCISWVADSEPKDRCSCTDLKANNMLFAKPDSGFATCADAAAAGHGMVVDLCPQYAGVTNAPGFPSGP